MSSFQATKRRRGAAPFPSSCLQTGTPSADVWGEARTAGGSGEVRPDSGCSRRSRPLSPPPSRPPRRERSSAGSGTAASGRAAAEALRGAPAIHPAANMATGGYRSGSTTDFLEEWKAKREKMRAKQAPTGPGAAAAAAAGAEARPAAGPTTAEPHQHLPAALTPPAGGANNCLGPGRAVPGKEPPPQGPAAGREPAKLPPAAGAPGSPEGEEKPAAKGKSSGPSARKGKGQIEKRKLREKRRSTGVVNIPAAESLDEYEDDEAGQKERKKEDAITQQNTIQNESSSADSTGSYLIQDSSRMVSSRYKSTGNAPEDDAVNRYSRTERTTYSRYSRDANSSGSSVPSNVLEKRIEELERELAKERQENVRLMKMTQDKEEVIGKLKEEIDLLNRDLDDIEDENEQLKQENKTLLKVVGQLTR